MEGDEIFENNENHISNIEIDHGSMECDEILEFNAQTFNNDHNYAKKFPKNSSNTPIARDFYIESNLKQHSLGKMNGKCKSCGATYFKSEMSQKNQSFHKCCIENIFFVISFVNCVQICAFKVK